MKNNNLKLIAASCILVFSSFLIAKELNTSNVGVNKSSKRGTLEKIRVQTYLFSISITSHIGWPKMELIPLLVVLMVHKLIIPIFTGGFIYAEGMLWGAKVKGDGQGDEVRVGGSTYGHGLKAGRIITDANGAVLGSDSPDNNHVWRVRKDWATADLTVDAANFYGVGTGDVSSAQIDVVRNQYEYDWMNWPAAWGAPYDDVNGDGSFDPAVDIPGYPGSDQTMWTIANDVPLIVNAGW